MPRLSARVLVIAIAMCAFLALPAAASTKATHVAKAHATKGRVKNGDATKAKVTTEDASDSSGGYLADYNGTTIDLADGWDGAAACLAPADQEIECFSSAAAAQSAASTISATEMAQTAPTESELRTKVVKGSAVLVPATSYCQGESDEWMWLYANSDFGGQEIGIQNVNNWFDLEDAGFGDKTSSYINGTGCTVYMSTGPDGGGSWLTASAWEQSTYVGSQWNDKINGVYISS